MLLVVKLNDLELVAQIEHFKVVMFLIKVNHVIA